MKCKILKLFISLSLLISTSRGDSVESVDFNTHNITLLSLYSIHQAFLDFSCDTIIPTNVILSMVHEHVVNTVNEDILNGTGITLTSKFVDTCNNGSVTLQNIVSSISTSHVFCQSLKESEKADKLEPMFAATGVFSGEIGVNINYLLGAFCLPVVASGSSSAELDSPTKYPYFLRSGASDIYRAQVIFDLLQSQQWYHVDLIYDSSSFGVALMNEFKTVIDYCDGTDFTDTSNEKIFRSPCVENYFQFSFSGDDTNEDTVSFGSVDIFLR